MIFSILIQLGHHLVVKQTYQDVPMTQTEAWPFHFGNFRAVLAIYCAVKLEFSPTAFDLLSQD